MSDLVEFLLARIAEDEAVASAAVSISPWQSNGGHYVENHAVIAEVEEPEDGAHIARHDPARVLAECEAKRRIVEACAAVSTSCPGWQDGDFTVVRRLVAPHPEDEPHTLHILALLALPHADHPDYREEWRP